MSKTLSVVDAIAALERKGAPILGITYTNEAGETTERDVQINVRLNFGSRNWGKNISKCVVHNERNSTYIVQGVDRNRSLAARRENPALSREEADKLSFRSFRADRISRITYGKKELV